MTKAHGSILVVEDLAVAAKVAIFFFERQGYQVECTDDGDKAVNLVKKNHYDGVCMDIGLPTISGVDACKAIRQYEMENHLPPIPIVALQEIVVLMKKKSTGQRVCKRLSRNR